MCFCDVIQQFWLGWVWLSVATNSSFNGNWPAGLCTTIGMIAQFFLVGSAAWNFAIAAILLRMLLAYKIDTLEWEVKYHHMFCWGTATICTFVPLFAQAYGYTPNIEIKYGKVEFECWIEEPSFQMCLYGPAMAFVFFALGLTRTLTLTLTLTAAFNIAGIVLILMILICIFFLLININFNFNCNCNCHCQLIQINSESQ